MRTEAVRKRLEASADRAPAAAVLRVSDRTTGEVLDAGKHTDATSPLLLASVSKMLTAACVLAAVDRGDLSLDRAVWPLLDRGVQEGLEPLPRVRELTVGALLHQTSGLPDVSESGSQPLLRRLVTEDFSFDLGDVARWTGRMRPVAAGNGRAYYADVNFDLLGHVLERVLDRPFEDVLATLVCDPLDLHRTRIPGPGEQIPTMAYRGRMLHRPEFISCCGPSGGVISTVGEVERFLVGFFGGELFATHHLAQATYRLPASPIVDGTVALRPRGHAGTGQLPLGGEDRAPRARRADGIIRHVGA